MADDLLDRLIAAETAEERDAIVLEISLSALSARLQGLLEVAAVPHQFDFALLSALDDSLSQEDYAQLVELNLVEPVDGSAGWSVHEATRKMLLNRLWESDSERFVELSRRAADYCLERLASTENEAEQNRLHSEEIYHRLVVDPAGGISRFEEMATAWANYEQRSYGDIERIVRLVEEHIDGGRLSGRDAARVRLWQARLQLIYGQTEMAGLRLSMIEADDADSNLKGELAEVKGDVALALDNDPQADWEAAADWFQQAGRPFDAHLVEEKLRVNGFVVSTDTNGTVEKQLPDRLTLKLLDNIEAAWINGVLRQVFRDDKPSFDLPLARGGSVSNSGRLQVRTAGKVDRRVSVSDRASGSGLSGLFEASGRSLLILGAPGSGKTITLLQLLDELIEQARNDGDAPVPLLFNLSSFGKYEGEFVDWLAEQGYNQYRLGRNATKSQLAEGRRFTLLLDGLDEVPNDNGERDKCVEAINTFMGEYDCGVVVCSRIGDYKQLEERLAVAQAVVLQPLSNQQIRAGLAGTNLETAVNGRWQLKETLRSPLLLSLFPAAFEQEPLPDDTKIGSVEGWQKAIFSQTVEQQLQNDDQSKGWLGFLARNLQKVGTTVFQVEELQPGWLPQPFMERRYMGWSGLILGLIGGLILGLIGGWNGSLSDLFWVSIDRLINLIIFGLFIGLIGAFAGGIGSWISSFASGRWRSILIGLICSWMLLGGYGAGMLIALCILNYTNRIDVRDRVVIILPSRRRVFEMIKQFGIMGLIFGLIVGLISGFIVGVGSSNSLFVGLIGGLIGVLIGEMILGLVGGLIGLVFSFISTLEVDERSKPGVGLFNSLRSGIFATVLTAIPFGLIGYGVDLAFGNYSSDALSLVIMCTVPIVFTLYGGMAWCQHWALRFVLHWHNLLPFRLVKWLDKMVETGLLRRVGGGYVFMHRSLMEYIAEEVNGKQ